MVATVTAPISPTKSAARLHRWYRRTLWWEKRTPRQRFWLLRWLAKKPARAARETLQAARRYGAQVEAEHGVPRRLQLAQQWWLAMRHGLPPETYYRYQLYLPEQRRKAGLFVHHQEGIALLTHLDARVSPDDQRALADKRSFLERCQAHELPAAPMLAEIADGRVEGRDWDGVAPLPECDLFTKVADLYGGSGGARWFREADGRYRGEDGALYDEAGLVAELCERSRPRPLVLQRRLENHPDVATLSTGGLATARIVTARAPGGPVACLIAIFKMPCGNSPVDNFVHGGVAAPIDGATGRLGRAARNDARCGGARYLSEHPDTGARIEGFTLPDWPAALELAKRAHLAFPAMMSIGWDIAFLEAGPLLVEGNDCWDVDLMQVPHRRPLGETAFAELYDRTMRAFLAARRSEPPLSPRGCG